MISENNCGYAIEPDNPQVSAYALEDAADNKEVLPEMGVRAQALAKLDFNRRNLADK